MIGLVVATHGSLGRELLSSVQMIIGPVRNARAVAVGRDLGLEQVRDELGKAIDEVGGDGQGVIIATDMFGGTPANVGMTFLDAVKVDLLTGVNLPMLLKFFNSQENVPLAELVGILKAYGQQSIARADDFLQSRSV
ncbi:MAG: hypothetical protein C0614_09585 [Desulfuromonas sp.]|nr:MAG: hypothetical protein C0614_09585 [Desulfuromonas sp.]